MRPIYAFQPRRGRDAGEQTLAALHELGVVHIPEVLNTTFPTIGTLNKVFVCAYAERILDEPTLVFLDSDTVVIAEPTDLDLPPETDIALRPADSARMNSRGPDRPHRCVLAARVSRSPALRGAVRRHRAGNAGEGLLQFGPDRGPPRGGRLPRVGGGFPATDGRRDRPRGCDRAHG